METVDQEVAATCTDLGVVRKIFQLALLCTKRQPSDRPTMHEVARVLQSLVPASKQTPTTTGDTQMNMWKAITEMVQAAQASLLMGICL